MKEHLKKFFFVLLVFLFIGCIEKEKNLYSKKELLEDYDQLIGYIDEYHPKIFLDDAVFSKKVAKQRKKIKAMSEYDFYQVIAPIVTGLNCGHSRLEYSGKQKRVMQAQANYLPVEVYLLNNKLYYISGSNNLEPGAEILKINKHKSKDIIAKLLDGVSSDGKNITRKEEIINRSFKGLYYMLVESSEEYVIKYRNNSSTKKITVKSHKQNKSKPKVKKLDTYIGNGYARLTIPIFDYSARNCEKFEDKLDSFFEELKIRKIDKLIVDLRDNDGGIPRPGNYLLSYLLKNEFTYLATDTAFYPELTEKTKLKENSYNGELYTIIDGDVFSTTAHVLSHLKDKQRGTIIGEESGGSFVCIDGDRRLVLNNTNSYLYLSTMAFSTTVESLALGEGIKPDVEINYTIEDVLSKKDLEMEYVLSLK